MSLNKLTKRNNIYCSTSRTVTPNPYYGRVSNQYNPSVQPKCKKANKTYGSDKKWENKRDIYRGVKTRIKR